MDRSRRFVRSLFAVVLVSACVAVAIAPMLHGAKAASSSASAVSPDVVISEFSFGTTSQQVEFVELFNRSCSDIDLTGWILKSSSAQAAGTEIYGFIGPNAVTLKAGQYYLLASQAYHDSSPAVKEDGILTSTIPSADGGVALFSPSSATEPVDQVGVSLDGYHEGTPPLAPLTVGTDQSYERITVSSGEYVDINDNAEDFQLVTPSEPQNNSTSGACGIPTVKISGNVTRPAGPFSGVAMKYRDITGAAQSVTTDNNGNYEITVPANWSGKVTPNKTGFAFTPANRNYANILVDQPGEDYSAVRAATPTPGASSVLINEVGWPGTQASASDQWIELYNPNSWNIDLSDWELRGSRTGTIGTDGVLDLDGVIPANGYFVIMKSSDIFNTTDFAMPPGTPTQVDPHLALSTYGEALYLRYRKTGQLIDSANYLGGKWPAGTNYYSTNRASMERHSIGADIPENWYTFAGTVGVTIVKDKAGNIVRGTPGRKNWAYKVNATPHPTATKYKTPTPRPPTPFAHMVINEFLARAATDWNQDKSVDVYDEFIEVKNLGPIDVDLKGWKLDSISSGGNSSFILPSTKLKTGERAVFYGSTTHISLHDSGGTVRLINTRSVVIDARSYGPVVSPDQSTCRIPDGLYWRLGCFPTPGNENSLTGTAPVPPPSTSYTPPPCLMADIVPAPFRDAECYGYGGDVFNAKYWDDQSGFKEFLVADALNKGRAIVK